MTNDRIWLYISPYDAFIAGITMGGNRVRRRIEYDELFYILTLPATDTRRRKV